MFISPMSSQCPWEGSQAGILIPGRRGPKRLLTRGTESPPLERLSPESGPQRAVSERFPPAGASCPSSCAPETPRDPHRGQGHVGRAGPCGVSEDGVHLAPCSGVGWGAEGAPPAPLPCTSPVPAPPVTWPLGLLGSAWPPARGPVPPGRTILTAPGCPLPRSVWYCAGLRQGHGGPQGSLQGV